MSKPRSLESFVIRSLAVMKSHTFLCSPSLNNSFSPGRLLATECGQMASRAGCAYRDDTVSKMDGNARIETRDVVLKDDQAHANNKAKNVQDAQHTKTAYNANAWKMSQLAW